LCRNVRKDNRANVDITILNSVVNIKKALKVIGEYDYRIIANDMNEAGEDAAKQIDSNTYKVKVKKY